MPDSTSSKDASLGEQLAALIANLPEDRLTLGELLDTVGEDGLLLLAAMLTLVFLIPVSIPGVSTVFGAAILLVGVSRLLGRSLWLPEKIKRKSLPADKLRPGLTGGMVWVRRMERIIRPHRLRIVAEGRVQGWINNLAFIFAALLLMMPFGLVPFSNTLPALALLSYALGFIQRDGVAVLLGHLFNIGTVIYFGVLIGGGGVAIRELLKRFAG